MTTSVCFGAPNHAIGHRCATEHDHENADFMVTLDGAAIVIQRGAQHLLAKCGVS